MDIMINMKKYFAPLEGITGYIFRNAYEKHYGGIDKYFAPFMSPADNCAMNPKERRDVLPDNNPGIWLVPQILTKRSEHFIDAATILIDMGYTEINLNLGCPSGTVCAKGKGAGFLSETDNLDIFLDDIYSFAEAKGIRISVKTRIGRFSEDEWEDLLDIYNRYPISELIIHPRIALDYYKGEPRLARYEYALSKSTNPVVYNGNLFTKEFIDEIVNADKKPDAIMLGRGLLYNPQLLSGEEFDIKSFRAFHDEVYNEYKKILAPDINVLYKMKELWTYWGKLFPGNERIIKNILKTKKYGDYEIAVKQLI